MEEYEMLIEDYEQVIKMRERELAVISESNARLMEMLENPERKNSDCQNKLCIEKNNLKEKNQYCYWRIRQGLRFIWRSLKKLRRMKI